MNIVRIYSRIITLCIVLFIGSIVRCADASEAAGSTSAFLYQTTIGRVVETGQFSEAFDTCRRYGGTITIRADYILEPSSYADYIYIPDNVRIEIPAGIYITLKDVSIWLDGVLVLEGTLDLSVGEGTLSGNGEIIMGKEGALCRRSPLIHREGEICLVGSEIDCGHTLASSRIEKSRIQWTSPVDGTWSFARPEEVPLVGVGLYDVIFTPEDVWTYQPVTFYRCGQVTVRGTGFVENEKAEQNTVLAGTSQSGSAEDDNKETVVVTKIVMKPSTIYTVVSSFSKRRPKIKKSIRGKDGKRIKLQFSSVAGKTGYIIQYATHRSMKKAKKQTVKKTTLTIRKLKKKQTYFLRVCAYRVRNKKRTRTKWSSIVKV